mmetsp:Transcript_51093/g.170552  ORF Transcript_51093/g.170552 Transcript_51093/m.170552 type:complete len:413 (+) Transcript_51093:498-1736(+)
MPGCVTASSSRMLAVRPLRKCFAQLYALRIGTDGRRPRREDTLMMCPSLRARKCGSTACMPYSVLFTLMRIISSMSALLTCDGCAAMPRPTLFTITSRWPKWASAVLTAASTSARTVTSATMGSADGPHSAATASSASLRRATRASERPSAAACLASAAPTPVDAPVTSITRTGGGVPCIARRCSAVARADGTLAPTRRCRFTAVAPYELGGSAMAAACASTKLACTLPSGPKLATTLSPTPTGWMPVHVPVVTSSPARTPRPLSLRWLASHVATWRGEPSAAAPVPDATFLPLTYCVTAVAARSWARQSVTHSPWVKAMLVPKSALAIKPPWPKMPPTRREPTISRPGATASMALRTSEASYGAGLAGRSVPNRSTNSPSSWGSCAAWMGMAEPLTWQKGASNGAEPGPSL